MGFSKYKSMCINDISNVANGVWEKFAIKQSWASFIYIKNYSKLSLCVSKSFKINNITY